MKVRIGKFLLDSNEIPIMLVLSPEDKANIAAMVPEANSFVSFPKGVPVKDIREWSESPVIVADAQMVLEWRALAKIKGAGEVGVFSAEE